MFLGDKMSNKTCNSCGKKVDMDAYECPHCSSHVFIVNNEIIYPDTNSFVSHDNVLHCPQCNSIISEGDNFCKNCGYQIQNEKINEKPNFCPKCGAEIEGKYKFCIKCGEPI